MRALYATTPRYDEEMKWRRENRELYVLMKMNQFMKDPIQARIDAVVNKLTILMINDEEMQKDLKKLESDARSLEQQINNLNSSHL